MSTGDDTQTAEGEQVTRTHRWHSVIWILLAAACGSRGGPTVRPGIDVLLSDSLHLVDGRRVGLLTNQTGIDSRGTDDISRLVGAGVELRAIFSPEHGFRGQLNRENIDNTVDSATGLPVFSLYGATRAPTPDMLDRIDVLLIDLQDIGARTYTYGSTALAAMRAAAAHGTPVVVLDRPNPVGGELVQGPVLDTAFTSFVGSLPVPLRHGMTLGELLRFANARFAIGANLSVVPADGWRRTMWFDATGLPWVRPSPSMPNLTSATDYPGTVLFEATNLSVGRGTPIAFQVVGAPWLDAHRIVRLLPTVPGATVKDTVIIPIAPPDGKYGGEVLPALRIHVTNRAVYDPTALAAAILATLRRLYPDSLLIDPTRFDQLAGSDRLRLELDAGADPRAIAATWADADRIFAREREPYLLYK